MPNYNINITSGGVTRSQALNIPDDTGTYRISINGVQSSGTFTVGSTLRTYNLTLGFSNGQTVSAGTFQTQAVSYDEPFQLRVERYSTDTYVGATSYYGDSFVGFDVTTGANACTVYYGSATKTVPANSTAYPVIFGKYMGVDDGTPTAGIIRFGAGFTAVTPTYYVYDSKSNTKYCDCVLGIVRWYPASISTSIPANFMNSQGRYVTTKDIGDIEIPSYITSIGDGAFYEARVKSFKFLGSNAVTMQVTTYNPLDFGNCETFFADSNYKNTLELSGNVNFYPDNVETVIFTIPQTTYANMYLFNNADNVILSYVTHLNFGMFAYFESDAGIWQYASVSTLRINMPTPPAIVGNTSGATLFNGVTTIEIPQAYLSTYQNDSVWSAAASKMVGV